MSGLEPLDLGLAIISKVIEVCQNVSTNKGTAKALAEQWQRTRDCLARASAEERSSYTRSLEAVQELGNETITFLSKFTTKSYLRKAWSHSADKEKFAEYGSRLNTLIQEMQLGCAFDTATLLSTHEADVEEIEQLISESESRAEVARNSMEAKLLAAIRSAEAAARAAGASGRGDGHVDSEAVARAVKTQVAEALAQQAREYATIVNANSEDDKAEVRRIILGLKKEVLESRPPAGVSRAALEAALAVSKNDLDARLEHLETMMKDMEAHLEARDARLLDAIAGLKINQSEAAPGKLRRQSMTARLEELRSEDVELLEIIGEGSFGQVYKGRYQSKYVAVKKLKNMATLSAKTFERFKREAAVMQKLNHPYVIHIWGMCTDPTNALICVELGDKTLTSFLYSGRGGDLDSLPDLLRVSLLQNVGVALAFTHEHGVYHRDIKPDNVLLVQEAGAPGGMAAKLTDFGLAKFKDELGGSSSAGAVGTCAYMAPEILDDEGNEEEEEVDGDRHAKGGGRGHLDFFKADMFSFGVLAYEIYAQRNPFPRLNIAAIYKRVVVKGERPGPIPAKAPKSVQEIIRLSWSQDPRERPHAKQVSKVLTAELKAAEADDGPANDYADHEVRFFSLSRCYGYCLTTSPVPSELTLLITDCLF